MANTRGAGAKKPAKKQAAAKAGPKKAPAKKAAKRASIPAAAARASSKPAAKPAKSVKPAAKSTSKPVSKSAAKSAPKGAKSPSKSPSKPSASVKPPASAQRASKAPPAKSVPPKSLKEAAKKDGRPSKPPDSDLPARRTEPVEPPRPAIPIPEGIGAHPDAQLTKAEVDSLYEKLVTERQRVVVGFDRHLSEALGEGGVMPDETDMAQRSTEQAYLIRFADKERKLLSEIEHALEKLRSGEYGVCEGTEEPIGYKRLELRPWTRYSVSYKEQMERERSQHRR